MSAMSSQITNLTIGYSTVYSLSRRSKKTSKLRATGLCERNSPVTDEFPAQRGSNTENVPIWWRHHVCDNSTQVYSWRFSWLYVSITFDNGLMSTRLCIPWSQWVKGMWKRVKDAYKHIFKNLIQPYTMFMYHISIKVVFMRRNDLKVSTCILRYVKEIRSNVYHCMKWRTTDRKISVKWMGVIEDNDFAILLFR